MLPYVYRVSVCVCVCVCVFVCVVAVVQLSQILGHSDQLYTRLPRGLRIWQYTNAVAVTGLAAAVSTDSRVIYTQVSK